MKWTTALWSLVIVACGSFSSINANAQEYWKGVRRTDGEREKRAKQALENLNINPNIVNLFEPYSTALGLWAISAGGSQCRQKIQALKTAVRSENVAKIKEFVFNDHSVVVVEGTWTKIYSNSGLTMVTGLNCKYNRSLKVTDGLREVFNSMLPSPPSGSPVPADYRSAMSPYLETLKACREVLGEDFVSQTIERYQLSSDESPRSSLPRATDKR